MNQLIDQRNEASTRSPYWPPSDSEMASANHARSTNRNHSRPIRKVHGAHGCALTHAAALSSTINRPMLAEIGCREGPGTK